MYTNFDEMPVTLSVEQAADALSISAVSLYKLIKKDKTFPAINIGRRIVIPKESLKEWIEKKVNS
jgi:excisionase family DNA binding protein